MTERRSVTVETLANVLHDRRFDDDEDARTGPGPECWKFAAELFAALPAEPTEPAGALDVERLEKAMRTVGVRPLRPRNVAAEYARLAPSEPRADSEGLRDDLADAMRFYDANRRSGAYPHLGREADIRRFAEWLVDWLDAAALRREQPAAEGERG